MRSFFTIALLSICFQGFGQTYGNEWIDYNKQYFSFKVWEDGIYKIDYQTLVNANVPVGLLSTDEFQIFGREQEIPLHIVDGGDSSLDSGDYIIFYGQKNDVWLDSLMYEAQGTYASPNVCLYNDTIEYFLTWQTGPNLRFTIETDNNFGSYTASNYIWRQFVHDGTYAYYDGERNAYSSSSFYTPGEGWGDGSFNGGGNGGAVANYSAYPDKLYSGPGAPNSIFHARVTTNSRYGHHTKWNVGTNYATVHDEVYSGYTQNIATAEIDAAYVAAQTPTQIEIVDDQGATTDYQAVTHYSLKHPSLVDFGTTSADFWVDNNPSESKIHLNISNMTYSDPFLMVFGDTPMLVDLVDLGGGDYHALIPNNPSGEQYEAVFRDGSLIVTIDSLHAVNGNGLFTNFLNSASLSSNLLMIYHPKLGSPSSGAVRNYAEYRASAAGGGYDTLLANVNELYQQFGGGIPKHIMGIRRFAHYIYNNSTAKPAGLFLLGKGIREANMNANGGDGAGTRFNSARYASSLIPSYGQPSSDVSITSNLEGSSPWIPLMPTGRVSARTETELQDYLDKIIEYEIEQDPLSIYDTPTKDWQKQVLHFTGGTDYVQQYQFQSAMDGLRDTIIDIEFGGNVTSVYKTSSNPLDPTLLQEVTDRISEGVSLMSYLGHYSINNGFEVNIDDPNNWNNQGKYPIMIVNSCYNGNIFQETNSSSEEFVQAPSAGAIAYIGNVGLGLDVFLINYTRELYSQFGTHNYGATLGEQMIGAIDILDASTSLNQEATCQQMVLHGDPMLRLNWHEYPEFEITDQTVYFDPPFIDLTVDSVELIIDLKNLGKGTDSTFSIEVIRDFPQIDQDSTYNIAVDGIAYEKTISFKLPVQPAIGIGLNTFTVSVDLPSTVPEQYDEINNNRIVKTLLIGADGILPVIPYDFAVVPYDTVTVRASTIDPIAPFNVYRFEIDTVDTYDSPEHRYKLVDGLGGVKEVPYTDWLSVADGDTMPLFCGDSTVYFWRVKLEDTSQAWIEYSFQHIDNKVGWGQDHFFQFKKNGFNNVGYDRSNRERFFEQSTHDLHIECNIECCGALVYENQWSLNGNYNEDNYGIFNWIDKLHVGIIDNNTMTPWYTFFNGQNPQHQYGNDNNGQSYGWNRPMSIFTYVQNDSTQMAAFQNLINNVIPDSFHIVIYSPRGTRYDIWDQVDSAGIFSTFYNLGVDTSDFNANSIIWPMAMYVQKGDTNSVIVEHAGISGNPAIIDVELFGPDYQGSETTPLIGPASNWNNVYWKQDPDEPASADSTILTITAFDIQQNQQYSIDTLMTLDDSILNLNGLIDANLFPYINLSAYYIDSVTTTPAQIDRLHVLYDPLPEAAIDGSSGHLWSLVGDTIQEGENIEFAVDVKNIFEVHMDSLLITYWTEDQNLVKYQVAYPRQDSLRVGETLRDTVTINTAGLSGPSTLYMEVNPYVNGSAYITDQPEQEHFNNLLRIPFYVREDSINPLLDVTFDGLHILNGDIVNPFSEILITLKDENEYLIMDEIADTAHFGVYLIDPLGVEKRIPFVDGLGNVVMQWIPAEPQHKRFKIDWPAEFEMDGTYTLLVQGSDKSGNLSAELEYRVTFEVIHESTITHMMNYPNPFSTSTRFVFTLTGSEVPDEIIIQIMTVTGRVVREITEDELGMIRIGRNISEYAWNGTDEFGDPLANGVYLYRVKAQINGEDIKHRDSGADEYFRKEFGKMYLMR